MVPDKLVCEPDLHFWFVYNTHQMYFFYKVLITKPEFKSFPGGHLIELYCVPKHILSLFCSSMFQALASCTLFRLARLTSDKDQSHTHDPWTIQIYCFFFYVANFPELPSQSSTARLFSVNFKLPKKILRAHVRKQAGSWQAYGGAPISYTRTSLLDHCF